MGAASFLDAVSLLLPNMRLVVTGDSDVPSPVGTSLLVCNHVMDGDWWSILMLGRCAGIRGSVKVFLRNECLRLQPQKRASIATSLVANQNSSSSSSSLPQPKQQLDNKSKVSFSRKTNGNGSTTAGTNNGNHARKASFWVSVAAQLLHTLLDFPVLSNENNYIEDREDLFSLLKSFCETQGATPVHLLLFPEGWSLHDNSTMDRKAVVAMSNEFAKREGRPQLKHLLLPRTTGFNASLESLRESSPVVYDVTLGISGVTQQCSPQVTLSSLWSTLRKPIEVHMRIKRYSMEEVLQDASWLDKQWAEKDRLLTQFARHQQFPSDCRGLYRHRVFETRKLAVENSVLSLLRLSIIPFFVPVLLLLSIPIFWIVLWLWIIYKSYLIIVPDPSATKETPRAVQTPSTAAGTPFVPTTPFGSPSVSNWRDMVGGAMGTNDSRPFGE